MLKNKLLSWLPNLKREVWILAAGRLLSQVGTGFTLFYAPIFFVNEVGLSATLVGIALGSASVSGIFGRFIAGSLADSPQWGRRPTLLLSAFISAIADVFLALTYNFPILVIGNLLMGLGIGLYWPATEAAVADLTTIENRNEAFAITRLADTLGLGIGVILGGVLIAAEWNYRWLFVIDGISFVVFFAVIYFAIAETYSFTPQQPQTVSQNWIVAFSDRRLMIFAIVNILFTTYIAQTQSTIPLYFNNFVSGTGEEIGFSGSTISALFAWHIAFAALCQLPIARFLNRFSRPSALMLSLLSWGIGFTLIWVTGIVSNHALIPAVFALGIMAIGMVSYTPSASGLVVELAPESLRGVYLSINSQCWAVGYFIGPAIGGWAMDQPRIIADTFWLIAAASIVLGLLILQYLDRLLSKSN
ncbi:MAG: MFS transporter [Chroococcales cyanobacterium]